MVGHFIFDEEIGVRSSVGLCMVDLYIYVPSSSSFRRLKSLHPYTDTQYNIYYYFITSSHQFKKEGRTKRGSMYIQNQTQVKLVLGGVAQLVERYIVDVDVAGSNPVSSDQIFLQLFRFIRFIFQAIVGIEPTLQGHEACDLTVSLYRTTAYI